MVASGGLLNVVFLAPAGLAGLSPERAEGVDAGQRSSSNAVAMTMANPKKPTEAW